MKRVIISGGGTGGHIFPAIAIANEIRRQYPDAEILFVGAKNRMEMQQVPRAGYPIEGLDIVGIERRLSLKNLQVPHKLWQSYWQARRILKQFRPEVAVGVGGYASAPTLLAAIHTGIPTIIQEQNSYAGLTNRWLGRYVDKICVAYPDMHRFFPASKLVYTGNPVRQDLIQPSDTSRACQQMGLQTDYPVLLVMGGSLGARTINQSLLAQIERFANNRIQVLWQTGKAFFEQARQLVMASEQLQQWIHPMPFIENMAAAYAAAHVVVARAGALTLSELAIVAKPAILVPSPYVAENHQTHNAMMLVRHRAARMLTETEAPHFLVGDALALLHDPLEQKLLSQQIKQFARPQATADIVGQLSQLAIRFGASPSRHGQRHADA